MWGTVLKRDLLGETREEDKFHSIKELQKYLKSEIEKQGENVVIRNLDVSLIDNLSLLFDDCENIRTLDLSGWKTSGVKDMSAMFYGCQNLESLDVTGWDTSNVKNMNCMFSFCGNIISLDLSGWDISKIKSMKHMFYYCPAPYEVVDNKIIKE